MHDDEAMARAVMLAETARRLAPPNPWVGCVIVRDGVVVGEGATRQPGAAHAEAVALAAAGSNARGAVAYTTLEPCSHHGRTAPCTTALIDAGVTRVVAALDDPDPRVSGAGFEQLRSAGITVDVGTGGEQVARQLAPYVHHRSTGRAYAILKLAVAIDGRVAAADGTSQWITSEAARADAHELRADAQAVVVGSSTALADQPSLTVRIAQPVDRQPLRVVLDGRGRVPASGPLADQHLAPTLIITSSEAEKDFVKSWLAVGADVEVASVGSGGHGVDLTDVLGRLGERGVVQALFEGGATVAGSLVSERLVSRLVTYVGGVTLGPGGQPMLQPAGPATLTAAPRWRLAGVRAIDEADVRVDWEPA